MLTTDRIVEILHENNIPCFKVPGNSDYAVYIGRDLSMLDGGPGESFSLEMGIDPVTHLRVMKELALVTEDDLREAIVKYDMVAFYADQWYDGQLSPR